MRHLHTGIDRRTFMIATALAGTGAMATPPAVATGDRSGGVAITRSVGGIQVICLLDASGPFTLSPPATAFPNATDADWAAARLIDPEAFGPAGEWHLSFQCFVVAGPGSRIALVDTGVGPAGSPASDWAPVPGRLPQALAEIGVDVRDVDLVVQTHLHSDHVGWAVHPSGEPVFPRARYVVQRAEIAALEAASSDLVPYVVDPLRRTGQLSEVDGRTRLAGGHGRSGHRITAVPTPGHTAGHQSLVVDHHGERMVMTGDVLVHAVQLANPAVTYQYEGDPELAHATRRRLVNGARRRHAVLATAHLNRPFVNVC